MDTADRLLASAGLIQSGDLVAYHGSLTSHHGLWLAFPCACPVCARLDEYGLTDVRFALVDPWQERSGPHHVRRASIRPANT